MLPLEFIVTRVPLSHQTRNRARLQAWKMAVRQEAASQWRGRSPVMGAVKVTVAYYHESGTARIDGDNMVKPIQDALNGVVYNDDRQIVRVVVEKHSINASFVVRYISPVLANGFSVGKPFVYVKIEDA